MRGDSNKSDPLKIRMRLCYAVVSARDKKQPSAEAKKVSSKPIKYGSVNVYGCLQ